MASAYPGAKQTFVNSAGTSTLSNPDHALYHGTIQDTLGSIQDVIGTTLGTNVLRDFAAAQFPVRATGVAATGTLVQTLVGGTLTSPTINTPTFSNGAVGGAALSTSAIKLGYAQITTTASNTATTPTAVASLTATVTIPAGGRSVKITAWCAYIVNDGGAGGGKLTIMSIWDGTVGSGTELSETEYHVETGARGVPATAIAVVTPAAGNKTYNIGLHGDGVGATNSIIASAAAPAFILVELI